MCPRPGVKEKVHAKNYKKITKSKKFRKTNNFFYPINYFPVSRLISALFHVWPLVSICQPRLGDLERLLLLPVRVLQLRYGILDARYLVHSLK
jgi:hypothetical protein